jgi:hypothetical protein
MPLCATSLPPTCARTAPAARGRLLASACVLLLSASLSAASGASAQVPGDRVPFTAGERLFYRAESSRFGRVGAGEMWVEGPSVLRGSGVFVLRMRVKAGLGPFTGTDESTSWLDPVRFATLRFDKVERHLRSRFRETVDVFPDEWRWRAVGATVVEGATAAAAPLDELSFIYFLRTVEVDTVGTVAYDRHYDAARRPTTIRFIGRTSVTVAAGRFDVIVLEMRVLDARRYNGVGTLTLHLTDDACRVPVRIESQMPVFGTTVLELDARPAHAPPRAPCDR